MQKTTESLETVAIRFAGDSGDGMQLTGNQFTGTTAVMGNDLSTFPDYPAEIRAPAGSLAGVSGFQVNFSSLDIHTPGDAPDVLVAMNPAALRTNVGDLRKDGILIADTAAFGAKNLERAGYTVNPLEDDSLSHYRLYPVDITGLTLESIREVGLSTKAAGRSKNFFALGLVYWMFNRPLEHTITWIDQKFGRKTPDVAEANRRALKAGYHFGETADIFTHNYVVPSAPIRPGLYRQINGNEATALGLMGAAELSGLQLFLGSYPITPASDILHHLSKHKHLGVRTFQAEDEIAGICTAIGAAYSGALAVTTTSGPGLALKGEALGLALMIELPLVVVNVQRGGPSTGLPTKTEQSDLLQAMFGRNGEAPVPIIAAQTPGDCFYAAIEAARMALKYMTPVLLLTDGYLANGAEPWPVPQMSDMEPIEVSFRTDPEGFEPYARDENLARPWAIPGTPGLEHRVGGLEKQHRTGNVSYDPDNHEFMIATRAAKVAKIADDLPPTPIFGERSGDLLLLGWGGTHGAIRGATEGLLSAGHEVGHVHLRNLNPLPKDLGEVLRRYKRVLVPELNGGQLSFVLRSHFQDVHFTNLNKMKGKPFKLSEITAAALAALEEN